MLFTRSKAPLQLGMVALVYCPTFRRGTQKDDKFKKNLAQILRKTKNPIGHLGIHYRNTLKATEEGQGK